MLEFLELIGRGFLALLRIGEVLEFLWHIGLGAYWLISPSFRRQVRGYEHLDRFAVYFGAFLTVLAIGAIGWIGVMAWMAK